MNKVFFMLLLASVSNLALAVSVREVGFDVQNDFLIAHVRYSGGCFEHQFRLRLKDCHMVDSLEANYVSTCQAAVEDITPGEDRCEALINRKVLFSVRPMHSSMRPMLVEFLESDDQPGSSILIPAR